MKKITIATLVCLCVLTASVFAEEKTNLKQQHNAEGMQQIHDEWERFWYGEHSFASKPTAPKRIARAVYFAKDKFSVQQFSGLGLLAQLGKLDDSEAGQAAQAAAIISGESVGIQASAYSLLLPLIQQVEGEVSFSAILEGDMDDTGGKNGVWLILYGHKETVTEIGNVLEIIAQGEPEKQKPQ